MSTAPEGSRRTGHAIPQRRHSRTSVAGPAGNKIDFPGYATYDLGVPPPIRPHLRAVLEQTRSVYIGFHGEVCDINDHFGQDTAHLIYDLLRSKGERIGMVAWLIGTTLEFYHTAVHRGHGEAAQPIFTVAEQAAAQKAQPVPGIEKFLAACRESGRRVIIGAITDQKLMHAFLARHGIDQYPTAVVGRTRPELPALTDLLRAAKTTPQSCARVAYSWRALAQARDAGMLLLGFEGGPDTRKHLAFLARVSRDLTRLADAMTAVRPPRRGWWRRPSEPCDCHSTGHQGIRTIDRSRDSQDAAAADVSARPVPAEVRLRLCPNMNHLGPNRADAHAAGQRNPMTSWPSTIFSR